MQDTDNKNDDKATLFELFGFRVFLSFIASVVSILGCLIHHSRKRLRRSVIHLSSCIVNKPNGSGSSISRNTRLHISPLFELSLLYSPRPGEGNRSSPVCNSNILSTPARTRLRTSSYTSRQDVHLTRSQNRGAWCTGCR